MVLYIYEIIGTSPVYVITDFLKLRCSNSTNVEISKTIPLKHISMYNYSEGRTRESHHTV